MGIVTYRGKGGPLTYSELDENFTWLDRKGGILRGIYAPGIRYNPNDQVSYQSRLYYCISTVSFISEPQFNTMRWSPLRQLNLANAAQNGAQQQELTADEAIAVGMLLARTATGVAPYDARRLSQRGMLLGIAMGSALPGALVSVTISGGAFVPGWLLTPGTSYMAGASGTLTTSSNGLAFAQVVGRAISADTMLFAPQPPIALL